MVGLLCNREQRSPCLQALQKITAHVQSLFEKQRRLEPTQKREGRLETHSVKNRAPKVDCNLSLLEPCAPKTIS